MIGAIENLASHKGAKLQRKLLGGFAPLREIQHSLI
jgi:hypothetical protein